MIQFVNLSNGFNCDHAEELKANGHNVRFLRIQSTHCEQKHWAKILQGVGPEFLVAAAHELVIVHDQSEKDRETRAMWQGLEWIRYALQRSWFGPQLLLDASGKQPPINVARLSYGRNGMLMSRYWEEQYRLLPKSTTNNLRHYRRYLKVREPLLLSCNRI